MTPPIRNPKVQRVGVLAALAAWATVAIPGAVASRQPPAALPPSAYVDDFDSAWTFIRDNYAYFDEKSVDWEQVRNRLRPRATAIRDHGEFIGLLEELVEHLYDHHAHLGVNTPSSPRLVPSGADLWAAHRGGRAVITQVRAGSDGERAGLRPGMEIVSIDGRPVADAVEGRLPSALDRAGSGRSRLDAPGPARGAAERRGSPRSANRLAVATRGVSVGVGGPCANHR